MEYNILFQGDSNPLSNNNMKLIECFHFNFYKKQIVRILNRYRNLKCTQTKNDE
jgi:hypothetical protein